MVEKVVMKNDRAPFLEKEILEIKKLILDVNQNPNLSTTFQPRIVQNQQQYMYAYTKCMSSKSTQPQAYTECSEIKFLPPLTSAENKNKPSRNKLISKRFFPTPFHWGTENKKNSFIFENLQKK